MLQVALGGHQIAGGTLEYVRSPTYYEPGFNLLYPLELQIDKCDRFYILIRKRADQSGTTFESLSSSDLSSQVKDVTNGMDVTAYITDNDIYTGWDDNPSNVSPVVLEIVNSMNLYNAYTRIRTIDCYVKDVTDNSFIKFRVLVDDNNKFFYYLSVQTNDISNRVSSTATGRQGYVRLNGKGDFYLLFSPYAYLIETTENYGNFSYPLNTIFYKRQNTYNNEDYTFSFSSGSHDFVSKCISVMNVPGYNKVGVVLIDNMLYTYIMDEGENAYANISIQGNLSDINDTFKVNFLT